jgi:hypothetical protein
MSEAKDKQRRVTISHKKQMRMGLGDKVTSLLFTLRRRECNTVKKGY